MPPRSRIGVTLTQAVVVLAIIAFVAAVLFPVFQKVQDGPRHGSCQSNLKQLGLAMIQYEQDADGDFPAGVTPAGNGWAGELYPFVKAAGVYHCPNDAEQGAFISYAENRNLVQAELCEADQPFCHSRALRGYDSELRPQHCRSR